MKRNVFKILILLFVIGIIVVLARKKSLQKKEISEIYPLEIKGVIKGLGGHGIYNWIEINNMKRSLSIAISKEIYKKGFPDHYTYEVGDSIIKKANTNEITIKNGERKAIFELDCH